MKHLKIGVILLGMFMGFSVGTSAQSEVVLNAESSANDSIIHVAYGSVNKIDLSNAISIMNPSKYLDKNYDTYSLNGADVFVGGNSLWNIGTPLVLIDGVPRSEYNITSNEIEQITYLKGANAVVLYGSRAANGVILITSKRGFDGKIRSDFHFNAGIKTPISYPDYLGSAEYMKYYNQALSNDGLAKLYQDSTISKYAAHTNNYRYPDVDYYSSEYLRKLYNTYSASAEFSGGNQKARFYTMAGFTGENSLLNFGEGKNANSTRFNVRGNIDLELNDFIKTYVNVATIFSNKRYPIGDYWRKSTLIQPQKFAPLIPIDMIEGDASNANILVDGSRNFIDGNYLLGGSQEYLKNPIADGYAAGYNTSTDRQFQYTGGVDIDLRNLLKGLSLHGQMNIDYSNFYVDSIYNTYAVYSPVWDADSISDLTKFNRDSITGNQNLGGTKSDQIIDFNVHLDYVNTFNGVHNVSGKLIAAGMRRRMTDDFQNRTNANIGIQASYNYDHKYYADFSGSIINSTKLPENKRVAFSPTATIGWLMSNEDFLKGSSLINRLKFSASAGIINTDLDFSKYYMYDQIIAPTAWYSWSDGTYTSRATTISWEGNKNLTYAKRKEVNIGIEGSMLNNSLEFVLTGFMIKKDGIPVLPYNLYPSFFHTGWPETSFVPYTNYDANSYKGFDFQVSYNTKAGEVNLNIGASGSYTNSQAEKRDELYVDKYRNRAGKPTEAIFGFENKGFFMSQDDINNSPVQKFGEVKPGDIKYKDQNGDGIIDDCDEVMIGRWDSPFKFGVHFTAQYKGFTLFVMGTQQIGGTGVKKDDYYWEYGNRKYSSIVKNSWTEETKNTATYPRLTTLSGDNNFRYSDFWTYSTDAFTLSKVQLTYSLPQNFFKGSFVKNLNIYLSGSDLLMVSKNKEVMQLNIGSSPKTRFFNLGIKAAF